MTAPVLLGDLLIDEAERDRMAEAYLSYGWWVLPLIPGSKLPATKHGVKSSVSRIDYSRIQEWRQPSGFWLGVAGSNVIQVLDFDVKLGKRGSEARRLLEEAGLLARALGVVSTPSGGWHYYFPAHPEEKSRKSDRWGLDWQCAGKYVAAPPTPGYRWTNWRGAGSPLQWVEVCEVLGIRKPKAWVPDPEEYEVSPYGVAADQADWLRTRTVNRNHALFSAACRVAEIPGATDGDFQMLIEASLSMSAAGETRDDEVRKTVESAKQHVSEPVR